MNTDRALIYTGLGLVAIGGANFTRQGYAGVGISALISSVIATVAFVTHDLRVRSEESGGDR